MNFSKYQLAIFDFVANQSGNAIVSACAGSGKTFSLVESLKHVAPDKKICLLAFNKAIAEELKKRVPPSVNVQTFHGLGWSVVNRNIRGATLNADKVYNHIQTYLEKNKVTFKEWAARIKFSNNLRKVVDFMRLNLVFIPTDSDIIKIGIEQDFSFEREELKIVKKVYAAVLKDSSCYDFVDMLFVPLYKGMKFPKFDFIAIDECQDLSLIQHKLFFSCMSEGARFIAFGDHFQAIYSFATSNANSYQLIKDYPNTTELPLSISYRCGKNIIKHAQELVPQIEAFSERGDGSVVHNGSINNIKDGDVILCRTNAPIVSLACKLLKDGRKAKIKGADFGKNLSNLIKESRAVDVAGLIKALNKNLDKLAERIKEENPLIDPQNDAEYQRSFDKTQCIKALCENCSTFPELNKRIESIFSDSNGLEGITLSTIHKFKGLEAKNIFIVEPQLIPFPYYLHLAGQKEVERNIDYVARTRAIEKLEYIRDWSSIKKIEKTENHKTLVRVKLTKKQRRAKKLDKVQISK